MKSNHMRWHLLVFISVMLLAIAVSGCHRQRSDSEVSQSSGSDNSQQSGIHNLPSAPFGTNGPVSAIAVADDGTTYIGGDFTAIVRSTGSGVPVDGTTGEPMPVFPKVAGLISRGSVNAVAADGIGGWFIGGEFEYVGGIPRNNIAHIMANGKVDPSWAPRITQDTTPPSVDALSVCGGTLYVGGWFNAIDGVSRTSLAALETSTGRVTSWDARVSAFGLITAIAADGGRVYVGGLFTSIGGQQRKNIAALAAATGDAEAWNPNTDMTNYILVKALVVSGNTVYLGGLFHTIGGQTRNHIAALDAMTGLACNWNPDAASSNPTDFLEVWAIAVRDTVVYVGGDFTIIGGQPRNHIAAIDATTGQTLAWNPNPTDSIQIRVLATSGNTVYVGGQFSAMGGRPRQHVAALDAETGAARDWDPHPGYHNPGYAEVKALSASGNTVFVGGLFSTMSNFPRNRIASFDKNSNLTYWNPDADAAVSTIAVSGGTVYAGGWFSRIGGQARTALAALDAATGNALDWNPSVICGLTDLKFHFPLSPYVSSLVANNAVVYAAGRFTGIGGQLRDGIAALDATTGRAIEWNAGATAAPGMCCGLMPEPIPSNFVSFNALALNGSSLYAAGDFAAIGGQPRKNIAALDVMTGAATSWNPNPETGQVISVKAIALSANTVYIGGEFDTIGSTARHSLAAIDASTAAVTDWNPNPVYTSIISALAVSGNTVYVGGNFSDMGGQNRGNLAALDAATGSATTWNHRPNGIIEALAIKSNVLYVGGNFTAIELEPAGNLAQLNQ